MVRYPNRRCIIIIYVRMKDLRILLVVLLASVGLAGCTSAYFSAASGSAFDDLYVSHDRTIIAEKQKAEAEARRAEAEARRAEALALQAEYEAQIAQLNAAAVKSGGATKVATALAPKQQVASDGLIIIDDDAVMVSDNSFNGFVANSYESAYARRLQGFKSATYRMPSSYFNLRYGGAYTYATAYDPAFYNIMVSGDQVWVEPRYITSMFGTWGATNATALIYSPWYYGWNSWHRYDPWYYSWYGYPRYSWYDWNWNICYGGGWSVNLWWGWGGHYHPWRPSHIHHNHHIGHGPHHGLGAGYGGSPVNGWWGGGNKYGTRHNAPRVVGNGANNKPPQNNPSRGGVVVNRGSSTSTPYRSPSTGISYGQPSRGNAGSVVNNSAGRGNATSGRGGVSSNSVDNSNVGVLGGAATRPGSGPSRNTTVTGAPSRSTSGDKGTTNSIGSGTTRRGSSVSQSSGRSGATSRSTSSSATRSNTTSSSKSSSSSSSSSSKSSSYSSGSSYSSSSSRGGGYSGGSGYSGSSMGGSRGGGGSTGGGSRGGR